MWSWSMGPRGFTRWMHDDPTVLLELRAGASLQQGIPKFPAALSLTGGRRGLPTTLHSRDNPKKAIPKGAISAEPFLEPPPVALAPTAFLLVKSPENPPKPPRSDRAAG